MNDTVINWSRKVKRNGGKWSYSFTLAANKKSCTVVRNDKKQHTFCEGDEFTTYNGLTMQIESFHVTDDAGVYGVGSGTDISLQNQLDKI